MISHASKIFFYATHLCFERISVDFINFTSRTRSSHSNRNNLESQHNARDFLEKTKRRTDDLADTGNSEEKHVVLRVITP